MSTLPSNVRSSGDCARGQRCLAGGKVEPARDEPAPFDLGQQCVDSRTLGQRLQDELDRAPAREPEPPCLIGGDAIRHGFANRRCHPVVTDPADDVVLDAAAGNGAHDETIVAHREHRTGRPRRAAPCLDHRDKQHAPSGMEPVGTPLQNFEIDAVHVDSQTLASLIVATPPAIRFSTSAAYQQVRENTTRIAIAT